MEIDQAPKAKEDEHESARAISHPVFKVPNMIAGIKMGIGVENRVAVFRGACKEERSSGDDEANPIRPKVIPV
mgnify:FL=1